MPRTSDQAVSSLTVKVNGSALDPAVAALIVEAKVKDSLSLPASAHVRITDTPLKQIDSDTFKPGNALEISMGDAPASGGTTIFKGEIVALEPEFSEQGVVMVIRGLDKSHRLQRERQVRTFQDVGVGDIVQKLTGEIPLPGSVSYSGGRYKFFQQSGETSREVIARLERDHDCRFFVRDGQYVFAPADNLGGETIEVTYTEELLSFRPRLTAVQQETQVDVVSWDPAAKAAINGSSSSGHATSETGLSRDTLAGLIPSKKVLIADRYADDTSEANKLAKTALDRRADAHFEAEGRCVGMPKIRAGCKLKLKGVGTRFGGTYVVTSATHAYRGKKGYTTSFVISGRSERSLLDLVHPAEKRDFTRHMVVGLVTNVNDPDKTGRVKVKFPTLPTQSTPLESTWARVVTLAAGADRGVLMLPEVDDEVVVAFENGDARRPLVVGAVFNGKAKPGDELTQSQDGSFAVRANKKAFVHTKDDMTFKSDKKLIIQVASDREEKADGKMGVEAGGEVKMKAGSSYTLEAGSSMSIKGASISVEAQGSLTLKGATVSIESQGPATLKGAILDLNASGIANLKGSMVNIG
jgi:phage protein D/phage baseplate assembly protein gpV